MLVTEGERDHPPRVPLAQPLQGPRRRALLHQRADEALGGGVLRGGEDVVGVAELDDAPCLHHRDAVGQRAHHLHLVGDQHDGQPELLVDPAQQRQDLAGGLRVQRAGRLVGEQDARAGGQCAGDAHALLLPARELLDVGVRLVGEADEVQQLGDPCPVLLPGHAGDLQRVGDVAPHGARGEEVELLEDHPDVAAYLAQGALRQRADLAAGDGDGAARGPVEGVDQAQQGRLAGPGVAHHPEHLALGHVEVDLVEGVHRRPAPGGSGEGAAHVRQADERGAGRAGHAAVSPAGRGCRPRPRPGWPAGRRRGCRA